MAWANSSRKTRLPDNWPAIRARILRRDRNTCTKCGKPANQVDHIAAGDNHADWNLTSLCTPCHNAKSSAEGGRAVHKGRRQRGPKPWRKPPKHPGLL